MSTVGNIDPETGEDVLHMNEADLIDLCRPLMADPQLPNKLAEGRSQEITPCTHCMNCLQRWIAGQPAACRVHASVGGYDRHVRAG
ncbi:MAG: hypothetical protein CL933_01455 [Deltaproteobacteria bacterium]|nr:hypothetical protein [Deltaproteobacteria bacterium]